MKFLLLLLIPVLHYIIHTIVHMRRYDKFCRLVAADYNRAKKYFEDHDELITRSDNRHHLQGLLGGRQWILDRDAWGNQWWFAFTSHHNSEDWYIKDFIKKVLSRQLEIDIIKLKDVFCNVNSIKIILFACHCENCKSNYNEGDVVLNISKNDDYNTVVNLIDTTNIIDKDFGRFDLSSAISEAVHWHYEKHLARETRETMTVKSRTTDGKDCYLIKSFEIFITYR